MAGWLDGRYNSCSVLTMCLTGPKERGQLNITAIYDC